MHEGDYDDDTTGFNNRFIAWAAPTYGKGEEEEVGQAAEKEPQLEFRSRSK